MICQTDSGSGLLLVNRSAGTVNTMWAIVEQVWIVANGDDR